MSSFVYSIIIPVYNSERTIVELCNRLITVFDKVIQKPVEIILVNDGSHDNSWQIMKNIHNEDQRIKIIRLSRNFGQHSALFCGLKFAKGDYVITMDDDLQHPPEEIPKLIQFMIDNPDMDAVIGQYESKKHSWWRNLGSTIMKQIMQSIYGLKRKHKSSSFKLIRSKIAKEMTATTAHRPRIGQLLVFATNNIGYIEVRHDLRKYGNSGYSLVRLAKDFLSNIINNSVFILHLTSMVGFVSAFISVALFLYYLVKYLTVGIAVSGFTSIVLINLFYFGIILFSLGVVGEYLIRILFETKGYPQFVIKEMEL